MAYHKKRRFPAPNKNQAKQKRRNQKSNLETLDSIFPNTQQMTITLRFTDANGNFLDENVTTYNADESIDLRVYCPGRCGDGEMDLAGKLKDIVNRRETVSESRAVCQQPLFAGSNETCGCQLFCQVQVSYA